MNNRMPSTLRVDMFDSIEGRLRSYMRGRVQPPEIAATFNFILYDELGKDRETNGAAGTFNLRPEFVGQYRIDKSNPTQTRLFSHQGTEACSPIPIKRGIIGRAITTGKNQYIPDVRKDLSHIACAEVMEESGGTEIVLLSWSDPYTSGDYKGERIPLGVLDIDLKVLDAFSREDVEKLHRIWRPYGKLIFPGEPEFEMTTELARTYKFLPGNSETSKKKNRIKRDINSRKKPSNKWIGKDKRRTR
jgi:putative methionine-R-sulfoxide reductase with GAF domain